MLWAETLLVNDKMLMKNVSILVWELEKFTAVHF